MGFISLKYYSYVGSITNYATTTIADTCNFDHADLGLRIGENESKAAKRFEPGTSDSKAKTIPLHKRV